MEKSTSDKEHIIEISTGTSSILVLHILAMLLPALYQIKLKALVMNGRHLHAQTVGILDLPHVCFLQVSVGCLENIGCLASVPQDNFNIFHIKLNLIFTFNLNSEYLDGAVSA